MKTTITFFEKAIWSIIVLAFILSKPLSAQVSPYSLSPDWYFGTGGRLTFPNGNFPSSGAPTAGNMPTNNSTSIEASTSVGFNDGSVAIYSNTMQVYNGNPANSSWNNFIRNFSTDNTCAGSSTGGAVSFPDPASPTNAFYLVTGNDETGGGCQFQGVNKYRFTGTGTSVAYNAGPTNMTTDAFAGEAITAGADGKGGYWVIVHSKTTTNTFRVWHYTATGITGPTDYTPTVANVSSTSGTQSYLKISPCQDKIAFNSGGILVINNFNRNTGAITNETLRITPADYGAGLEFSPDGSKIYFSGQGNQVRYADTATGTITSLASSASWSMQLGPDGKIYTSPSGSTSVGVISNANGSPSYSTVALPGGASLFRGLSNIAWLNPNLPVITASTGCPTVSFSYAFKNYFNTAVSVVANSEEWDFDEGSGFQSGLGATPSHTFATVGTYNVRMKVKDATCNQYWLDSVSVTLSCSLPVSLLNFTGNYKNGQTALQWSTASETNNNYFEVQRSNDGIHFYTIGKVKGNGTTLSYSSYSYTDNGTTNEIMYYRLIQYDLDGKNTYSNTIAVNPGLSAPVVSPNPFSNSILVSFQSEEPVQLKVLDILGRVVETKTMEQNSITLGESLNKGSYIISVNTSTENYYYRVIKE